MAAAGQVERSRTRKMDGLIALVAFVVFAVAWAAFAAALVWSQGSLDAVWEWLRGLPLLPLVAGLWVWETGWPTVARLVVIGGLALATLYTFLPRSLFGGRS
jgi:hypothetical protein